MTKLLATLLLLVPVVVSAAGGTPTLHADVDLGDKPSLQRGAKLFVNYCLSCHGAKFMRYNRMAKDLGISEDLLRENLMFAADKVGETMDVAMLPRDAEKWFGTAPPDLSVTSRSRGADWLYTYLLTFYKDDDPARSRTGVNNLTFRDVGMPAVLWERQGVQVLQKGKRPDNVLRENVVEMRPTEVGIEMVSRVHMENGGQETVVDTLKIDREGTNSPEAFRRDVRDLVNFMVYLGEPAKMVRYRLGTWALLFLVILFIPAYFLKKEYWKNVR